jgi:hypothetical protein
MAPHTASLRLGPEPNVWSESSFDGFSSGGWPDRRQFLASLVKSVWPHARQSPGEKAVSIPFAWSHSFCPSIPFLL